MLYARNKNGDIIRSEPKKEGYCRACKQRLITKCGEINVWHWSHKVKECDSFGEGETKWHISWKLLIKKESCEVMIKKISTKHIADIVGNRNTVIELQHSPISPETIWERETFYGNMIWLFDAQDFRDNIDLRKKGFHYTFRWKYPRRIHGFVTKPLYWDFNNGQIFHVKKIHYGTYCGGWGYLYPEETFKRLYLSDVMKDTFLLGDFSTGGIK